MADTRWSAELPSANDLLDALARICGAFSAVVRGTAPDYQRDPTQCPAYREALAILGRDLEKAHPAASALVREDRFVVTEHGVNCGVHGGGYCNCGLTPRAPRCAICGHVAATCRHATIVHGPGVCGGCGGVVRETETVCPHCGRPIPPREPLPQQTTQAARDAIRDFQRAAGNVGPKPRVVVGETVGAKTAEALLALGPALAMLGSLRHLYTLLIASPEVTQQWKDNPASCLAMVIACLSG